MAAEAFPKRVNGRWVWPTWMAKPSWGPRAWNWLHEFAIRYPQEPTEAQAAAAAVELLGFIRGLPCDECRNHALAYLRAMPADLANTYALQRWMWTFHNAVNYRLKKPMLTYAEYQQLYAEELARAAYAV